jgi:hypothetical protein
MLGILLWYFIWTKFSKLSKKFSKPKPWVYGLSGVISYMLGSYGFIFIFAFIDAMFQFNILESISDIVLSLIAIPVGVLFAVVFYQILKRKFSNQPLETDTIVDDLEL